MQLFTASPSRCTVHAPQLPVSQPMCVPVRPEVVAEEVDEEPPRGHLQLDLLAVDLDRHGAARDRLRHYFLLPAACSDGAHRRDLREVASVVGGAVDVGRRVERCAEPVRGSADGVGFEKSPPARRSSIAVARTGEAATQPIATRARISRNGRRRIDDVRPVRADREPGVAVARAARGGHVDLREQLAFADGGHVHADEELVGGDGALAGAGRGS